MRQLSTGTAAVGGKRPRGKIPLEDLVDTLLETECPEGFVLLEDVRNPASETSNVPGNENMLKPRKIPRTIHFTSKSRCVTPKFKEKAIKKWMVFSDHKIYFHNDAALHRFIFEKSWPEFPQMHLALKCSRSMVEYADLWRALIIWEYGGIYTDMDNTPRNFNASSTLQADDEAFFEVESYGFLSQYFFAAEPRHPLMYLLVMHIWDRLFRVDNVENHYAPIVTGPHALKDAMKHFMGTHQMNSTIHSPCLSFEKVCPGHYVGLHNRTVTVASSKWAVRRSVIRGKQQEYEAMNMSHFSTIKRSNSTESCFNRLYAETRSSWDDRIDTIPSSLNDETQEQD